MRVHLQIKAQDIQIPFDHQHLLTGTVHKWLGWNSEHGKLSLYSFSHLTGCKLEKNGFYLKTATSMFFSAHDSSLVKNLISGIMKDPSMFNGLSVTDITIEEDPDMTNRTLFFNASPILIKRKNNDKVEHIIFNDSKANDYLKETLISKMKRADLIDDTLRVMFDNSYLKAGTKKITYKEVENRCNWCPIIIEGKPESKLFAWNVGLGNSTGIGFGAIK